MWTFEGTGEVTVNWFSLYTMQQLIGIEPWTHPWLKPHKAKIAEYLKKPVGEGPAGSFLLSFSLKEL